jgi:uncharacterized damage-inducible protein DinB
MPGQAPALTDERELLFAYLTQQRDGIRYAAHGLTEAQARLTPSASSLSIGGLMKHVATMERGWIDMVLQRQHPIAQPEAASRYEEGFCLLPHETLAAALAAYAAVARDTEAVVRATPDLNQVVPVPRVCRGSPPMSRPGPCAGCSCTSLRRRPATPGTPTSFGSRSTGPRCMP